MTRTAELASSMRVSVMRLSRRLRVERADHGLTLTQISVLATLDRHGPLTPRELAQHERVQPPSMTRTLAGLEERALIVRTPHASDGRQHLISLATPAVALLREDRRRRDAWLAQRLADLTQAERDVLRAAAPIIDRITSA
ncbi:MAG TPA: MarR family transcriptional regulator [Actinomycetes bacterium]|nr:MarR family transcriptional regulator [Actinomycetes bacterium]